MKTSTTTPVLAAASAGVLGLLAGLYVPDADAHTQRARYFRPSGICEAPLPVYDNHLRKAPMKLANTGTAPVFVSCAVPTDPVGTRVGAWLEVHFRSVATASRSVSCTMVTGTADAPVATTATRTVAPGANTWFTWSSIDKGSAEGLLAVQCTLPPGVEMTQVYTRENNPGGGI
jgi:hypothetical protein